MRQGERSRIFHLVPEVEWENTAGDHEYLPDSLSRDGYIHCSSRNQVVRVANALFHGRDDLLLIEIDAARFVDRLQWEDLYGLGEEFPHLYQPLPLDAVTEVRRLRPDSDGRFRLPQGL